jgi:hypothetical protein
MLSSISAVPLRSGVALAEAEAHSHTRAKKEQGWEGSSHAMRTDKAASVGLAWSSFRAGTAQSTCLVRPSARPPRPWLPAGLLARLTPAPSAWLPVAPRPPSPTLSYSSHTHLPPPEKHPLPSSAHPQPAQVSKLSTHTQDFPHRTRLSLLFEPPHLCSLRK